MSTATHDDDNNSNPINCYKAGDCVRTIYGAGVVTVAPTRPDELLFYTIRLWRVPGQSIASAVPARLTSAAVRACVLDFLRDARRHTMS